MSLRHAINQMCKECIYDPVAAGNWRQQVSACTSPNCPLFPHRPQSKGLTPKRANSCHSGSELLHKKASW